MVTKKKSTAEFKKPRYFAVLAFTLLYIAIAAVYFYTTGVTEFMFYLLVLLVILGLVSWSLPYTKLPLWALWGLSILGLLHALGGGLYINGHLLYDQILIPIVNHGENGITIWRFDQLVHPYGTAIGGLIMYYFIARATTLPRRWIALIAALASMGFGSLNEVVEFIAKLTIPHTDVGGYDNTLLDLCSNMVGASLGAFIGTRWLGKHPKP